MSYFRRTLIFILVLALALPLFAFANSSKGGNDKQGGPPAFVYEKLINKFQFMDGHKVKFNHMNVKFDVPPVIKEGRTLIPVRAIEAMGAEVLWDSEDQIVTITKDDIRIFMDLKNGKVYVVDSKTDFDDLKPSDEVTIDVKPGLINNRTFVPLRFIAETLGLRVDYDDGEIDVVEEPKISPKQLVYNTKADVDADGEITLILKDYTFDKIKNLDTDLYSVSGNKVYLHKGYILSLEDKITLLTFVFEKEDQPAVERFLTIQLNYNQLFEEPELDEASKTFDSEDPDDISVEMDPNDYTFKQLKLEGTLFTNYTLVGSTITFDDSYLSTLTEDTEFTLVFEKEGYADVSLKFTIELK